MSKKKRNELREKKKLLPSDKSFWLIAFEMKFSAYSRTYKKEKKTRAKAVPV